MSKIFCLSCYFQLISIFSGFVLFLHLGPGILLPAQTILIIAYDSDHDSMPDLVTDNEAW